MVRLSLILFRTFMMVFVIMSSFELYAQSYHTDSKKAVKNYESARQCFYEKDYDKALSLIDRSLSYDTDFTDALLLKAELLLEKKNETQAISAYEMLFSIDSMAFPRASFALAKLYMNVHRYNEAVNILEWFLTLKSQKEDYRAYAGRQLNVALFRKDLYQKPVTYDPQNIGSVVNTNSDEYVNQYYPLENKLVFTKRYQENGGLKENVFVSTMYDSIWSIPQILFDDFEDVGAANISSDGNEIYFSASNWSIGKGSCDIYCVKFVDGKWTEPMNVTSINSSEWESQPCLTADGMQLYFVRSNRKKTSDIYVVYRQDDGSWGEPERLNSNINTDGNEMAPFVHYDGQTLYFASDTRNGMGGYDLFMSRKDRNNEWSEAVNLGYPLNTEDDEINIVIAPDAKTAFISSKREGGNGAYDIYDFEIDEKFRPQPSEPCEQENPYLYALNANKSVSLKNIHFEFDRAELTADSYEGIMTLVDFLISYNEINVELIGHTDDMGDENYNISLSERRAENIRKALVDKGVSIERIKIKGCGATQPLFPNDSDKHRALNRRVEMRFSL